MKSIHIIGGGTVFHIRPHLSISAIAYGNTALQLASLCETHFDIGYEVVCHLTKMANKGQGKLETNNDVKNLIDEICLNPNSSIIFLPVALCDFKGTVLESGNPTNSGKNEMRLKSREKDYLLKLTKADKLIGNIKYQREDITLIGFKTTSKADKNSMVELGQRLLVEASCDFVYVNDVVCRKNIFLSSQGFVSTMFDERLDCLSFLVKSVHDFVKDL